MNLNHLLVETRSCLVFMDMHKVGAQKKVGSWRVSLTAPPPGTGCEPSQACRGFPKSRGEEAGSSAPHRLETR